MSDASAEREDRNVQSIAEFLRDVYEEGLTLDRELHDSDERLHRTLGQLRVKLYALALATDANYEKKRLEVREALEHGTLPEEAPTVETLISGTLASPS